MNVTKAVIKSIYLIDKSFNKKFNNKDKTN
jgi:hypothetical protein